MLEQMYTPTLKMKKMLRKADFHVKEIEDTEIIHTLVRQSALGVITE